MHMYVKGNAGGGDKGWGGGGGEGAGSHGIHSSINGYRYAKAQKQKYNVHMR